jgi:hypothetical protein
MRAPGTLGLLAVLLVTGCSASLEPPPATESEARAIVAAAIEAARVCESDADCVVIGSPCPFGCMIAVHRDEADDVEARIADHFERFPESRCDYGCPDGGPAGCDAGLCTAGTGSGLEPGTATFRRCAQDEALPDDAYQLIAARHAGGDVIEVDVGYSGGCETHAFVLCWDGEFMESDPIQVRLDLRHEAFGDMCEAYIEETLAFDVSSLREAYATFYGGDSGVIVLNFVGDEVSVTFSWD